MSGSAGGPNKWLTEVKRLLVTGLVVVVVLQFLSAAIMPVLPYLVAGLVLLGIIAIVLNRGSKL